MSNDLVKRLRSTETRPGIRTHRIEALEKALAGALEIIDNNITISIVNDPLVKSWRALTKADSHE